MTEHEHSRWQYLFLIFVFAVLLYWVSSRAYGAPPTTDQQHRNYGGSCGWASLATGLETKGLPRSAAFVRANYRGEFYFSRGVKAIRGFGLEAEVTYRGDAAILEGADCAIVNFGRRHAVLFCGYWRGKAVIYNPNRKRVEMCDKASFIRKWKQSGGQAVVIK